MIAAYTLLYGFESKEAYFQAFILLITTLPIYMGATYYTIYYILPHFLFLKNYRSFVVHFIYMSLVSMLLELLIIMFVFVIPIHPFGYRFTNLYPVRIDIGFLMIGIYLVILLGTAIKLLKYWYAAQQRNLELSKEKVEAELKLLKSQIHPHFLFNTLNNLYALTLKKSDQAPEVILKLSELLDYMLYECNVPAVSLEKELQVLQNYIALEKLRYGERLSVTFQIYGRFTNKKIAPLLLFPFVENSIKHGAGSNNQNCWINIEVKTERKLLTFNIENSVTAQDKKPNATGLGLKNVRKRLDLLYRNRHQLLIENETEKYSVKLTVDLSTIPGETVV